MTKLHDKIIFGIDVVVPRIMELGMAKWPNEACGLVIPQLDKPADDWVHELANRSPDPMNSYQIDGSAMRLLVDDPEVWADVLVWHTHPSGHVGPSKQDWDGRIKGLTYLVVALPGGEAAMF